MDISQINGRDYTLAYVDACPSELIQKSQEVFLCVGIVTFSRVKRSNLKPLSQYKKTRGLKRKIQTQEYIIKKIQEEDIFPVGLVSWNFQVLALKNGLYILNEIQLLTDENISSEKVMIANHEINLGLAASLSWYSIVIAIFLKYICQIAKIQKKKRVGIFLDLLPGDNVNNQRNFEIVEELINSSRLSEFQTEAIQDNGLELLGFGYGRYDKSTKDFKNDYEFVITDWIIQSFHSLLKYEKDNLSKDSDEYQLSKLARFLLDENRFEIRNAFNLV